MLQPLDGVVNADADNSGNYLNREIMLASNQTGLVAEFLFGRNASTSLINAVGTAGSLVGAAPAYGDLFVTLDGDPGAGIDTKVSDYDAFTLVAVMAFTGDTNPPNFCMLFGSAAANAQTLFYTGDTSVGGLNWKPALQVRCTDNSFENVTLAANPAAPLGDFRVLMARCTARANPTLKIDEFKGGALIQSNSKTLAKTRQSGIPTLKMGAAASGTNTVNDPFKASATLAYNVALSDAQALEVAQDLNLVLGKLGIEC